MGVRLNGRDRITYNHFDSYPDGLGTDIVEDIRTMLRQHSLDWVKEKVEALRMIDQNSKPDALAVLKLSQYADRGVRDGSLDDWYVLMRNVQGKLYDTLKVGYMIDSGAFMADSLFCEWAYIVNLDDMTFEVYCGFQEQPHQQGRYAGLSMPEQYAKGEDKYYPVALVKSYPLLDIPPGWGEEVQELADPDEEEQS